MVRASSLLKVLPYAAGVMFAAIFVVGFEISTEAAALADAGSTIYQDSVDVQVFWLQSKACVILPPDGAIANCNYLPMITVMLALTIMLGILVVAYGLLRRRISPIPKRSVKKASH